MKSTAKQENKFNFKRNIYIPKMCVNPCPVGFTTTSASVEPSPEKIQFVQKFCSEWFRPKLREPATVCPAVNKTDPEKYR